MNPELLQPILYGGSGLGVGLGVKILYDWLDSKGRVPRAGNGFMTSEEIFAHCANQQRMFREAIESGFSVMATELRGHLQRVDERLDRGDRDFDKIENDLREVVQDLKNIGFGRANGGNGSGGTRQS